MDASGLLRNLASGRLSLRSLEYEAPVSVPRYIHTSTKTNTKKGKKFQLDRSHFRRLHTNSQVDSDSTKQPHGRFILLPGLKTSSESTTREYENARIDCDSELEKQKQQHQLEQQRGGENPYLALCFASYSYSYSSCPLMPTPNTVTGTTAARYVTYTRLPQAKRPFHSQRFLEAGAQARVRI
ncbi:hypothetical protein SCHPADRAFT_87666 [Schizopora paradoxa]|uniref:Uncharacterized protein n=1 Tax=Schizopora paradoxa TaxID=27342 RepID=A0A0H2S4I3_9AGAM|nr:hypothetical protein SCHPADRAFT_87666 [Schizopora paradoxa]